MATYDKISELLDSNPEILRNLVNSDTLEAARVNMVNYLSKCELDVRRTDCPLHPLEKKNVIDCINVFRNLISPMNEKKTSFSCLKVLWEISTDHWREKNWTHVSDAFLVDMKHLYKGVTGLSGIYSKSGICKREVPAFVNLKGRDSAILRSNLLDEKVGHYYHYIKKNKYLSGLDKNLVEMREKNKQTILAHFKAGEEQWVDENWQKSHTFHKLSDIRKLISLSDEEAFCIEQANKNHIPFGITPYYLSLFNTDNSQVFDDRALRDQVIPNKTFVEHLIDNSKGSKDSLDYMHEKDTSPVNLVTRRYPMVSIFKPSSSCPQICVYCQRDWEIREYESGEFQGISKEIDRAFAWYENNPYIKEVLITGGDPLSLRDDFLFQIIERFFALPQIERIRIGTRAFVTMPMRFTEKFIELCARYHHPPTKNITFVTHVQHSGEVTPEVADVVLKLKKVGINVLNQQVFTLQNCRKFETCFLRETLFKVGITPYYLFNLKGKEETDYFRVPIARLLQEQKEEARLMPGIIRTDKPVFNIPTLGKNDIGSWQDHDLIMILADGRRVYEFYPWEKYMAPVNTFLYHDAPIYDFLKKIEQMGEDVKDYSTIWYYF